MGTFWLDKICIDQTNIKSDLACLPIFLGACNRLLILNGPTYSSRLWCVLELYVFFSLHSGIGSEGADVIDLSQTDMDVHVLQNFDARHCACFSVDDYAKIMTVISNG